jgi:hypothetical protein
MQFKDDCVNLEIIKYLFKYINLILETLSKNELKHGFVR